MTPEYNDHPNSRMETKPLDQRVGSSVGGLTVAAAAAAAAAVAAAAAAVAVAVAAAAAQLADVSIC